VSVPAVARAVCTSVSRQYQLNMIQFDAWVRDFKTSIRNIQTSITDGEGADDCFHKCSNRFLTATHLPFMALTVLNPFMNS
jgi:hypothetical protein